MSGFDVRVLTTHGQAMIASATAGNRIVFSSLRVSGTAMDAATAAAAVVTDFSVSFGPILSASADGSVCRVSAKYTNPTSSEQHLKSFALCGRLENALTDDVIAVQSGADVDLVLAPNGTPGDTTMLGFNLTITGGGSVIVDITTAGSAALSDLDRFVSLHKAGDPSTGENQAIWGTKTFHEAINPVKGLAWPVIEISGCDISVESQLTGFTGGGTQEVHHVFRMTDQTHSVTHGLKCVFDGPTEKMTLSSDVDRVELPGLVISPEYSSGTQVSAGRVVLLYVTRTFGTNLILCGDIFTGTDGWSIYTAIAKPDGSFDEGLTDLSTKKFRAMNDVQTLTVGESAVVFAQCIE